MTFAHSSSKGVVLGGEGAAGSGGLGGGARDAAGVVRKQGIPSIDAERAEKTLRVFRCCTSGSNPVSFEMM